MWSSAARRTGLRYQPTRDAPRVDLPSAVTAASARLPRLLNQQVRSRIEHRGAVVHSKSIACLGICFRSHGAFPWHRKTMAKTALIFGVSGQDGAYLAKLLLDNGYKVWGSSRDRELTSFENLRTLEIEDRVQLRSASLAEFRSVLQAIDEVEPDEIYNLAGQSSVGLSFEQPVDAIDGSVNGTINILESLRFLRSTARFYNASSSECFGNTGDEPARETTRFLPCSPYAVGKAASHWLVSNYRDAYGLFACSGILFNHESPLRRALFVTQKIIRGAVHIAEGKSKVLPLGNLDISRDWGWAPEYVVAMWRMLQLDRPEDFVVATGRMHSLRDFAKRAFAAVNLNWQDHVVIDPDLFRPLDIVTSVGDAQKARLILHWTAATDFSALVERLIAAEFDRRRRSRGSG
jgi:GDPmannose 4,6-dehydratase